MMGELEGEVSTNEKVDRTGRKQDDRKREKHAILAVSLECFTNFEKSPKRMERRLSGEFTGWR